MIVPGKSDITKPRRKGEPVPDGYFDLEDVRRYLRLPNQRASDIAKWMQGPENPLPHVRRPGTKPWQSTFLTKREWIDDWLDRENAPDAKLAVVATPARAVRRASPDLWRDLATLSTRARELGISWDSIPYAEEEHAQETRLRTLAAIRWSLMERIEELVEEPEEATTVKMLAGLADTLYRRNVRERGER